MKENKKVRKQELDQESDQINKKTRTLGRVLVFLLSYLLVNFYKFPPQQ